MDTYNFPIGNGTYTLRSTNEEVEVTSFNQFERGDRSDTDWVTYIDSKGKEHIREHLNLELDFKATNNMFDVLKSSITTELPTTRNTRVFEMTKLLLPLYFGMIPEDDIVKKANDIVDKIGVETYPKIGYDLR